MKLAVSNIAWSPEHDEKVFRKMQHSGFEGLEIAPTRLFAADPYEHLAEAREFAAFMKKTYGIDIISMQSLYYGKNERIAGSEQERENLFIYTKKALAFADALDCRNVVFGCPRNRRIIKPDDSAMNENFLQRISDEAAKFGIVISLEANPVIYNNNYVTGTFEAIKLLKRLGHPALKLNLDLGTILANNEDLSLIECNIINHVHISEPYLEAVRPRDEHKYLREILDKSGYKNFISIEMKRQENIFTLFNIIDYVKELFA